MKPTEVRDCMDSISSLMELSLTLHQINKTLESKCGLSVVQWSLLKTLLNMPAVSPLVLAKALGVTPGTLTQTLTRLDRKKFLFMCDDPNDARKKMISITRLGKEALETVDREYERAFAGIDLVENAIGQIDGYLKTKVKIRLNETVDVNVFDKQDFATEGTPVCR